MKKNKVLIANLCLFSWFGLDMVGFNINGNILVSSAWKDDGIYFIIYSIILILFIFYEKVGKNLLLISLSIWFITQFLSHEYYTLFGGGEKKIDYFSNTIKLFKSSTLYIPDLYHIVLHLLIIISLFYLIIYIRKSKILK